MLVLLTFYPDSFLVRLEKLFHNNFLTQMKVSFAFFPSHIFFQNWDDFWCFQANFDVFLMLVASKIVSLIGYSFYDQFLSHVCDFCFIKKKLKMEDEYLFTFVTLWRQCYQRFFENHQSVTRNWQFFRIFYKNRHWYS